MNHERCEHDMGVIKVYKDKSFLIFLLDSGGSVKYDFATNTSIGKSGKVVKDICSQLRGTTIDDIIKCCEDVQYAKFLSFVKTREQSSHIRNIGTILSRVPHYSKFEQFFSANIVNIDKNIKYKINEIPKGLIKYVKRYDWYLNNNLVDFYNDNPNMFNYAINNDFVSISERNIYYTLTRNHYSRASGSYKYYSIFNELITDYGYTIKALWEYLDYLMTFEALLPEDIITELWDYAVMMEKISPKFDKYPRHFLTTHKIAIRNYNRLKEAFDEEQFKRRINKEMETTIDDYVFIYPDCTQDIKDEAVAQNNCVASYIRRVISGDCDILFMRYVSSPKESLVTIEVRKNKIVQAKRRFNDPVSDKEQEVINRYNKWYANMQERKEEFNYEQAC